MWKLADTIFKGWKLLRKEHVDEAWNTAYAVSVVHISASGLQRFSETEQTIPNGIVHTKKKKQSTGMF